jgi:glutathione S-transferase
MTEFTVYSVPGSPFGRSVLMALEEKGASWHLRPTSPRDPAHLARHPFARVPVIEHEGFSLYETQAILRYLDRILPDPVLTPDDAKSAARMDQAMNISDWYLFQGVGNVIAFQRIVGPRLMGLTPNEEACAAAVPRARTVFAELAQILGARPFSQETRFRWPTFSSPRRSTF